MAPGDRRDRRRVRSRRHRSRAAAWRHPSRSPSWSSAASAPGDRPRNRDRNSRGRPPLRPRPASNSAWSAAIPGTETESCIFCGGSGSGTRLRRMSHISSDGSRLRSESCDSTQREPQKPSPTTTPRRSSPAGVSPYSTAPPLPRATETMPAFSSSFNRLESSAGDMRGTPRLRSLKRVVPAEQFAQDQRRPARAEDFGRHRNRAELSKSIAFRHQSPSSPCASYS